MSRLSNLLDGDVVAFDEGEAALDIKVSGRPVEGIRHDLFFNADTGSTLLVYWPELAGGSHDDLDVRLKSFVPEPPVLHDPGGARTLPIEDYDYDVQDNVASVRVPVLDRPLILEYPALATGTTVTASVGLRVGEIIARHQRAQTRQDNLVESYFASVRDEIHFRLTIDSFDVIMESRFYSDREGSEWEELSFSFNGARWGSDRPAFPLLQPEKVLSLPLDLQLDQDYEYELKGRGRVGDRECYDRAWGDDPEQSFSRVSFSGLGVSLNVRGPWHTIVRVEVGKSFLPEALRGAGTVVTQFLVLKPL